MDLLQLTYFCHAAETENFAKTARHFGIPAAGVSQSIKRLEKELGVSLFDRSPNGIRLNARGESFYLSTKSALSMLEDAKKKARDEEVSGECRLLVMTCREVVGEAIRRFREKHKELSTSSMAKLSWSGKISVTVSATVCPAVPPARSLLKSVKPRNTMKQQ